MSLNLQHQIGQMLIAGFKGLRVDHNHAIINTIKDYNIGGVILYDEDVSDPKERWRNIQSPGQTLTLIQSLQEAGAGNLFISVDQEGGFVQRLKAKYGFPPCPTWNEIGTQNNLKITKVYAQTIANTLANNGFNLNLAPVVDLQVNRESYLSKQDRCVSADPQTTAAHAVVFINAHHDRGVFCTLKHFPGLGSTFTDTHEGFTDISATWSEIELEPYKILFERCTVDLVMVGHCFHNEIDPDWPGSMSYKTITGLLRNQLGYNGVVICDDPSMDAISKNYPFSEVLEKTINAGVDLLCFGNNLHYDAEIIPTAVETIHALVQTDKISKDRINESIMRIKKLKSTLVK